MSVESKHADRVRRLEALADPVRLSIVDSLVLADVSPGSLSRTLQVSSNLLAHHVAVLVDAGVVTRVRSEADRRRTYLQLVREALDGLLPADSRRPAPRVLFVCTQNSARSQLAAAVWRRSSRVPVASAGTRPAPRINPGAVKVARRHGLALERVRPRNVRTVMQPDDLVVSVCDSAHEELEAAGTDHLHWSVPDPVRAGTDEAFEDAYRSVAGRVVRLAESVTRDGDAA
jgi:protein-tyrosine-phosphatase/DNA-binding HxlR family transcriptional regulator